MPSWTVPLAPRKCIHRRHNVPSALWRSFLIRHLDGYRLRKPANRSSDWKFSYKDYFDGRLPNDRLLPLYVGVWPHLRFISQRGGYKYARQYVVLIDGQVGQPLITYYVLGFHTNDDRVNAQRSKADISCPSDSGVQIQASKFRPSIQAVQ